eukprot:5955405-Pleurochrysis_carterae.AAC.1
MTESRQPGRAAATICGDIGEARWTTLTLNLSGSPVPSSSACGLELLQRGGDKRTPTEGTISSILQSSKGDGT